MKDGMVIAIEPMVNLGVKEVSYDDDGWTVRTQDRKPSAHYEHTICIRKGKADILSSFSAIELAEKANPHLNSSYYSTAGTPVAGNLVSVPASLQTDTNP